MSHLGKKTNQLLTSEIFLVAPGPSQQLPNPPPPTTLGWIIYNVEHV